MDGETEERKRTFLRAAELASAAGESIHARAVSGRLQGADLLDRVERLFARAPAPSASSVLEQLAGLLGGGDVQTTHPAYFGPAHPSVRPEAAAAALLVAAFNPQRATDRHSRAAQALEQGALGALANALGWSGGASHFTHGGQEANTEALAAALAQRFPSAPEGGVQSLKGAPVLYVSEEAHHSFDKAAALLGLGRQAVRRIAVGKDFALDLSALGAAIDADRRAGRLPFFVAGTAGSTASGAIDPLSELAELAAREELWFHGDAAWAGGLLLCPRYRHLLAGLERADSISVDAHKALDVPLTAGMLFVRHPGALERAFFAESPYMPGRSGDRAEPYQSSLPWSRPALGLPFAAVLATVGEAGIAAAWERRMALAEYLREQLLAGGFELRNSSPLPLLCLDHPSRPEKLTPARWAVRTNARGRVWLAPTRLPGCGPVLRVVIANHRTEERHLDLLLAELHTTLG